MAARRFYVMSFARPREGEGRESVSCQASSVKYDSVSENYNGEM